MVTKKRSIDLSRLRTAIRLLGSPSRFVEVVQEKLSGRGAECWLRICGGADALARSARSLGHRLNPAHPTERVVIVVSQLGVPAALATGNFLGSYAEGLRSAGASVSAIGWSQIDRPFMLPSAFLGNTFLWRLARPKRRAARLLRDATVVAVHYCASLSLAEIASMAPMATVIVMCVEHPETTYAGNPQAQRASIDLTLRFAHGVVVTSEFTRALWLAEGLASDRILRVTTAIPTSRFGKPPMEAVTDRFRAVYTGNIAFPEALALVRIARAVTGDVPDFRLDVYADASPQQLKTFEKEILLQRAAAIVQLHPAVSGERVSLIQMNAGVLVAYQEDWLRTWVGFPSKLGEYFATGRPVICCDTPSLAGVAIDGRTAFVARMGDESGFVQKIVYALQHPAEANQVGRAGRERIREVADNQVVAAELLRWVESIPPRDTPS